jgi:hypothetical protein
VLARRVAVGLAIAAVPALAFLVPSAPAKRKQPGPLPCEPGRYLLLAKSLTVAEGTVVGDAVEVGAGTIALPDLCPAVVPKKLAATRKGVTRIKATWPTSSCTGLGGKRVRLTGRIARDCGTLVGKVSARKVRRKFKARLSRCGDGTLDAGAGEGCEPPGTDTCTARCVATPELGAQSIARLADVDTAWKVGQWNWVHQVRARTPRTYPDEFAALMSLGPVAGEMLVEQFDGEAPLEQDFSLCIFAYLLERLDHRPAVPALTAWLERNTVGELLRAPDCVTHALKVLTDQEDRDDTYFSYPVPARQDAVSRAMASSTSVPSRLWSWLAGIVDPRPALATQQAHGATCANTFEVTGADAHGAQRTVTLHGISFARDFGSGHGDEAKRNAESSDEDYYGGSGYEPVGEASRLQDCAGQAGEQVMGIVTNDGSTWNSGNPGQTYEVAETFGERVKNLNGAQGDDTVIHFQHPDTGVVDHVAWVAGRRGNTIVIRMKDGNGRPRELELAPVKGVYEIPDDDPQLKRWAGTVPVYHRFDKSKVTVTDPPFCAPSLPPACANIPGTWHETDRNGDVAVLVFRADGTYDNQRFGFTGDWACEAQGGQAFMLFHREPSGRYTERYTLSADGMHYEGTSSFGAPITADRVS